MLSKKHIYIALTVLGLAIAAVTANTFYTRIYGPSVLKEGYLYIPTGASYDSVQTLVRPFLRRMKPFQWVAKMKKYPASVKPGRYKMTRGMSNNDLINMLRIGAQEPVKLTFNNQDDLPKLAGRIATQIEPDSVSLLRAFTDEKFLAEKGFTSDNALCMYIPNTYEMYWNTSAESFREKMWKEYNKFWNEQRRALAKKQNLTPLEVCALASIVQKESAVVKERKTIAGLYLNRLRSGWPLQADPTVIFAKNKEAGKDLQIKRVLTEYLDTDSPYNTYLHTGLPPGPIGMPDISSVEAVLQPEKHSYYYMCASVSDPGSHVFAKTLAQHNLNKRKYTRWADKMGYRK